MQSRISVAGHAQSREKQFATSGKSLALFHHRAIRKTPMPLPGTGLFGAIAGRHPSSQLTLHRLASAKHRRARCRAARVFRSESLGDIDVTTIPDLNTTTTPAAIPQTRAAAAPRIKLLPHGFCIDHPDPELGERLMGETLGVSGPDAMHGILRQLVRASV
jgi:hypothetical protein